MFHKLDYYYHLSENCFLIIHQANNTFAKIKS